MAKKDDGATEDQAADKAEVVLVAFHVPQSDATTVGLPSGEYDVVAGVVEVHESEADFLASLGWQRA